MTSASFADPMPLFAVDFKSGEVTTMFQCRRYRTSLKSIITKLLMILCVLGHRAVTEVSSAEPVWTVTKCVGAPSHVHFDPEMNVLFVSQINGEGDKKDGDGFISQLNLNGLMIDCGWSVGLDAPKGIARRDKSLWVSDIDVLRGIDAVTGELKTTLKVPGAKFLTGVVVDPRGAIYVADMLASTIFQYQGDKMTVLATGSKLDSPSGLVFERDHLVAATWGLTTDYTTQVPGRLFAIEKQSLTALSKPIGNLYGVVSDGATGWIATDFSSGRILHLSPQGILRELFQVARGVGGVEYIASRKLLVVAEVTENRISAYDLSTVLKPEPR